MAYKEVQCIIKDVEFQENIPEEGNTYDPYVEIIYQIVKSDEPHDVGLLFKSVLFETEIRDLVGLSRPLGSREMINFVKKLNLRTEPFTMIVDVDDELVTADMLMLDEAPKNSPKREVPKPLHERIEQDIKTNKRFDYRKKGDIPINNINYADTDDNIINK